MFYNADTKNAVNVLNISGEMERFAEIRYRTVYQDEKVRVIGVLPLDYINNREFAQITVEIRKPADMDDTKAEVFRLQSKDRAEWTLVLAVDDDIFFMRPGQWQHYLNKIVETHNKRARDLMRLHNEPIDDKALFKSR